MPKIVFIRHAESEYNRDGIWAGRVDCSLTEKGIESAKKLGNTIENNFDAIYCSPLKRAKQTLEAIFPNAKPIYDERIIEISIGEWEDKKKDLSHPGFSSEKPGFFIFKGENHESESVQGIGLPRSGAARCRTGLHGDANREGCQQDTQ